MCPLSSLDMYTIPSLTLTVMLSEDVPPWMLLAPLSVAPRPRTPEPLDLGAPHPLPQPASQGWGRGPLGSCWGASLLACLGPHHLSGLVWLQHWPMPRGPCFTARAPLTRLTPRLTSSLGCGLASLSEISHCLLQELMALLPSAHRRQHC